MMDGWSKGCCSYFSTLFILSQQFVKFDPNLTGEISERTAAMMFEKRGSVKTATEIRSIVEAMNINKDHNLSFVEWCCAYFKKDFAELNNFVDEAARDAAIKEAMKFGMEAKQVEEEIEKAKLNKEVQAQLRAAAIERESKLVRTVLAILTFPSLTCSGGRHNCSRVYRLG